MSREKFLKHGITPTALLMSMFFWSGGILRAQTVEAPLLPMNIEFRYVPQYLDQSILDDPRYARIQALLDEDGCHIILLDKTTGREAFYSAAKRRVDAVAANGNDASVTPMDCNASSPEYASPAFLIHFHDQFGNDVSWRFVGGQIVPHASPEVIVRADSSGIIFLYAPRRAPSAEGTRLTIAGREYLPESTQSQNTLAAFYATDMTVAQIMPGTELWEVERSPADMTNTAEWNVVARLGGRQRTLAVKELSATEASIEQSDVNDPDAPHVILNLVRVNDAWELRSLSFESHFNTLRTFFGPQLPLPTRQTDDKTIVIFTVAENELSNIASGKMEVRRAVDAEHIFWYFESPSLARGITLETGVNLISGVRSQAINEAALDLLR